MFKEYLYLNLSNPSNVLLSSEHFNGFQVITVNTDNITE